MTDQPTPESSDNGFMSQLIGSEDATEAAVVAAVALRAARPTVLAEEKHYAFVVPDGHRVEEITGPTSRTEPERKTGTARLLDATSFAAYFLKHAQGEQAELYADPAAPTIVGLLNGNGPEGDADVTPDLGFGDHRVVLAFRPTVSWTRWAAHDGKLLTQVEFAEHIERCLLDVVEPEGAVLLEIAESFQAKTAVDFESATRLQSGQQQFSYKETTGAKAGQTGKLEIPKEFVLGIVPYEGSKAYRITARLRYRLSREGLKLGYQLDRPEDILRAAFDDVLVDTQERCSRIALLGTPPG